MFRSKKIWPIFAIGALLVGYGSSACAVGNVEAGELKFSTCIGCHGRPGVANVYPRYNVPKIGGQKVNYILSALKAYRIGSRRHGSMEGNARGLSEQDMEDIAAYLAQIEFVKSDSIIQGDAVEGNLRAETCITCHGLVGNGSDPNNPRLAGQYESYLVRVLKDYKSGKRKNALMGGMVSGFSDEDIENLAAFFSSQSEGLSVVHK